MLFWQLLLFILIHGIAKTIQSHHSITSSFRH
jgi:hypothetical protein